MKKLRAIYKFDIRFSQMPVFEYNPVTNKFHQMKDEECAYDIELVANDDMWIIFEINDSTNILNFSIGRQVVANSALLNDAYMKNFVSTKLKDVEV